ncbi:extracytoplasmic binding receptor [Advenella kashmirensis WT001]|uniref:Extracytoplasmic binding receptor n=1 Tax=Advenella kashmirensis (strain DSM 17095 / LMG 22695 / WT001) TaxID=1036672 RepID=I3UEQ4_ADVKW|nr:tripartite tricarboxylate transporter substrate binding protein [Advenella kashmirensis]AFK63492.1 extracytoplasmic binding receptor [Advenella kashmirensis WT001]
MDRRSFLLSMGAGAIALPTISVGQEKYPAKPISYIVPVAAGGGSDYVARATTSEWGKGLGNATFVVENLGGGGGVIACQRAARAPADGYTLMQGYVATLGTGPATRKVPYDPLKDFTPVGMIGGTPNVLVVDAKLPITTLTEFVDYFKRNTTSNYGSAGAGSLTHLLMELLKQDTGLQTQHIAYKGIAPAFQDLVGARTQAMFPGLAAAVPHLLSKTVRAIALTGNKRNARFPDIPTFEELGVKGFDDVLQWYGVSGPRGMKDDIVKTLNDSLNAVLIKPELEKRLQIEAILPMPMNPQEFEHYVQKDLERWKKVAQDQNIRLDA